MTTATGTTSNSERQDATAATSAASPTAVATVDAGSLAADRTLKILYARQRELITRIHSGMVWRSAHLAQLQTATGGQISAIDQQVAEGDAILAQMRANLVQIESQIAKISAEQKAQAGTSHFAGFHVSWPARDTQLSVLAVVAVVAVAAMLARTVRGWRRSRARTTLETPRSFADSQYSARELTGAIDALAIEVERIGESQRFIAQVLTGKRADGSAVPVMVKQATPTPI